MNNSDWKILIEKCKPYDENYQSLVENLSCELRKKGLFYTKEQLKEKIFESQRPVSWVKRFIVWLKSLIK
jgi:hypothetical protein